MKTQLYKIGKPEGFLGKILGPLLKPGLPLIGNIMKPWAKIVLISLGLTAAAAATDVAIHIRLAFGLSFACRNTNNSNWRNEWY